MEEKQRQLEERGVAVEKALRGEAGNDLSRHTSFLFSFFLFFKQLQPSLATRCIRNATVDRHKARTECARGRSSIHNV